MGGLINGRGLISGWAYKRNKINASERRDDVSEKRIKANIPVDLTHLLCVKINREFISKHLSIKQLCDWNNWNGTDTIDGLINGGISRILSSLVNGWPYIRGILCYKAQI